MWNRRWSFGSKGKKKKKEEEVDDEGDFGAQFEDEEFGTSSTKRTLPVVQFKGPNSISIQLSGPHTFAIVGRNKKIRDELSKIPGSRHGK